MVRGTPPNFFRNERIINFASFYCGGWRCGVPGECPMVTKFLQSFIAVRQRRPDTICSRAPGRGTMKEKSFGTDLSSLRLSEDVVTRQQPRDNPRCYIITTSHHSQQCCLSHCHCAACPRPYEASPEAGPGSCVATKLVTRLRLLR